MDKLTLQKLFRAQLAEAAPALNISLYQLKAAQAISGCRTEAMGSHGQYCSNGHLCGVFYNSCRHRGCPQCQYTAKERWLAAVVSSIIECSASPLDLHRTARAAGFMAI